MGMMYVTRLLVMERDIAKERFLRQLIRRWRYIAFSKKLAMNKMKTIYKNLHMTYLEMANCLFGDDEHNEPSVIKEFERFGSNVGIWENEKPDYAERIKHSKSKKIVYSTSTFKKLLKQKEEEDKKEKKIELEEEKEDKKEEKKKEKKGKESKKIEEEEEIEEESEKEDNILSDDENENQKKKGGK